MEGRCLYMGAIGEWITQHITEPLQQMIIDSVNGVLITFLNNLVDMLTGVMTKEVELAKSLLDNSYIVEAVKYSIGIAIALLAARIAFQAFQNYIAYSTGDESHPGELLKEAASATAVIACTPWLVKQIFVFCFSIVDDIQGLASVPDVNTIQQAVAGLIFSATNTICGPLVILMIAGFILWLIILIQMSVRAVNIAILMVTGPFLWAFKNDLGRAWLRALLSQCFAIPVQMFMLRGALGCFASIVTQGVVGALLFIGFMWATIKFPAFLQQLVAQTGVGSTIGGTVQHVGSAVLIRKMMARG